MTTLAHLRARLSLALALALAALTLVPALARASTAARTVITNTASVAYNDAGGTAQTPATASAAITVTLVPAAPVLSSPVDVSVNQGQTQTLTYTITGTANGLDTYAVSAAVTASANATTVTAGLPANFTLGGTTLAAATTVGATTITVPYDQDTSTASINGLAALDYVVLGGTAYQIKTGGIAKDPVANTATITLTAPIASVVPAGLVVGQQRTFTVSVPSGTLTSGSTGSQTVSTKVTSTTSPTTSTTQSTPTKVTVNRATLTVTKLVSIDGGATFGATASATPGTSLVYKIVVSNGSGSPAGQVVITDALPLFLSYVPTSGKLSTDSTNTYGAAPTTLTDNAGGYAVAGNTVTYTVTTLAAGSNLVLFFRAQIN